MDAQRQITVLDDATQVAYKDGAIFVARRVSGAPKFNIAAAVTSGSIDDRIPGQAHIFEHCPFQATESFPGYSIKAYAKKRGGRVGASTGYEKTTFTGEGYNEHAEDLVFAVAELVCKPAFTVADFDHEKAVILTEWAEFVAKENVVTQRLLAKAAIQRKSLPHVQIGDYDSINSMRHEDAMDYYKNNYFSDRLIVAMEGDIDPARALDVAQERFVLPRGLAQSYKTFKFAPSTVFARDKNSPAARTHLLFDAPDMSEDSYKNYLSRMVLHVLTGNPGPIYDCVRNIENPLVYSVRAGGAPLAAFRASCFEFTAFPKNVEPTILGIARAIKGFVERPDRDSLEETRARGLQDSADSVKREPEIGVQSLISDAFYRGVIEPRNVYVDYYKRFTCEELVEIAKELFLNGKASVVYRGATSREYPNHKKLGEIFSMEMPAP